MNATATNKSRARHWRWSDYMMTLVLLALCVILTAVTWREQSLTGPAAAEQLAISIEQQATQGKNVFIALRDTPVDRALGASLAEQLPEHGLKVVGESFGTPALVRDELNKLLAAGTTIDFVACNQASFRWGIFDAISAQQSSFQNVVLVRPETQYGSAFLTKNNLLNVANQIAVIAILSIGMTIVVITGGIDLSVGSLIALSAVGTTLAIRDYYGGIEASNFGITICSLGAIALCALVGLFNGTMITQFHVPPFIATLSILLMTRGLAKHISEGASIDQVPERFIELGRGTLFGSIPNSVLLMAGLYALAHLVMTRTVFGRYIYAVGGNAEAARLSGVPVQRVLLIVYILCGALAGLGGVVMASQLKSGAPTYGLSYEMYVIAAVVVGGTSLSGGQGRIFNTLVGAFIIAVINNGMNLIGISSAMQEIVRGSMILAAVGVDKLREGEGQA